MVLLWYQLICQLAGGLRMLNRSLDLYMSGIQVQGGNPRRVCGSELLNTTQIAPSEEFLYIMGAPCTDGLTGPVFCKARMVHMRNRINPPQIFSICATTNRLLQRERFHWARPDPHRHQAQHQRVPHLPCQPPCLASAVAT